MPHFDQPPLRLLGVTVVIFALVSLLLHSPVHGTHINLGGRGFGFAFALLLFAGPRLWPGVVAGTAAACLLAGQGILLALATGLGNGLATALVIDMLKKHDFDRSLSRLKDYRMLLMYGAFIAPGISAACGTLLPLLSGAAAPGNPLNAYVEWWLGDSMGLLNAAPALLIWFGNTRKLPRRQYMSEFAGLLLIASLIAAVIFSERASYGLLVDTIPSLMLMALIVWAAISFGRHATSLLIVVFFSLVLVSIRHNVGMFADEQHYATLLSLWWFIALFSMVGMTLAIVLHQLRQTQTELHLAAQVFANSHEGIVIVNTQNRIVSVNAAFTTITGYAAAEAIGKTPELLRSGKHDADMYDKMANQLNEIGHWDGETWNRRKDGSIFPVQVSVSTVRDSHGDIENYISIFSDITERKASEERTRHLAQYDFLTDLPNRALLLDRLAHELASARRYNTRFAVMFIDLDHFKPVNDTHGHDVGDSLLCEVARRLKENVRDSDTVSRQGGDEFIILAPNLADTEQVALFAQKLLLILAEPYRIAGHELRITPSIGIAIYPHDGEDIDSLIKNADTAMYRAKSSGRNNLQCYGHCQPAPGCDEH
ncbi:sensor domain-containing diguanylate cyclase [Sterolibacterium denitrificans]|uniref:bifunctional diguanylate cyclase/phosphodiesterase n=1 Tax=Sterolibacterium denitrificans TaxID=157592 RepID=UPI001E533C4E|nr:sensor domain-containing diguanylate cyclase [Sterolibacterium denitrificans]